MVLKNCKACDNKHHGPWGSMCLFVKAAKEKCLELKVSEDEFRLHLDFTDMEKYDSGAVDDEEDEEVNQAMLKDLVRINRQQQARVDKLVELFEKTSIAPPLSLSTTIPVGGGVPFSIAAGGAPVSRVGLPAKTSPPPTTHATLPGVTSGPSPATVGLGHSVTVHAVGAGLSTAPALSHHHAPGVSSMSSPSTYSYTSVHPGYPIASHAAGGVHPAGGFHSPPAMGMPYSSHPVGLPSIPVSLGSTAHPMSGSPASVLHSPLTPALGHLLGDTDTSTRGIQLRPEFHVQHIMNNVPIRSINYKSMSYYELMLGMAEVAKFLYHSGGDIASYLGHMIFVARQAQLDAFVDSTFVQYDHILIDAVLDGDIPTFLAGYPLAQSMCFHSANHKNVQKSKMKWPGSKKPKVGISSEICYNFNFKTCDGCERIHACKNCKGNHRAPVCPKEKSSL